MIRNCKTLFKSFVYCKSSFVLSVVPYVFLSQFPSSSTAIFCEFLRTTRVKKSERQNFNWNDKVKILRVYSCTITWHQSNMNQNKRNVEKGHDSQATYIRCPYNRSHYVLDRVYESHVDSCGQRNSHINVIVCPYNGSHRCRTIEEMVNWRFYATEYSFRKSRNWVLNFFSFRISILKTAKAKKNLLIKIGIWRAAKNDWRPILCI